MAQDVYKRQLGAIEQLKAQHIIDVVQGNADDLTKAQRQDGQIVAGQAQGRDADEHTEQTSHDASQHQTDGKGDTCLLYTSPIHLLTYKSNSSMEILKS